MQFYKRNDEICSIHTTLSWAKNKYKQRVKNDKNIEICTIFRMPQIKYIKVKNRGKIKKK